MPSVAALLAAGGGTRFLGDSHKLLAPLGSSTVWEHALSAIVGAGFDHVVVVTGAVDLRLVDDGRVTTGVVTFRHNPRWADGQASSVAAAVEAAELLSADRITIGLADQPFIPSSAWAAVATAPDDCRIVVAEYDGRRGPNPVRLDRSVWPLLPHTGDAGARHVIAEHPSWVCAVPCLGSEVDIDTLEDLERWKNC